MEERVLNISRKKTEYLGCNEHQYADIHLQGETVKRLKTFTGAKTIKKNTNSTQNKSQTHRAKQYEVTSFLSTDWELSTETCSKNVYSLGPWYLRWRRIGELDAEVTHRVCSGWKNRKRVSGVFCDRRMNVKINGKVYRTVVRSALMYGAETWALKKAQENKLEVAEMRMLR